MPEPELTPTNCTGVTCSVTLGRDPTDIETPNALLAVVNRDERTIECNNDPGNLTPGLRVKRATPGPDIPYVERTNQTCGNMLRIQNGPTDAPDNSDDLGLTVLAPLITTVPNAGGTNPANRVTIPSATTGAGRFSAPSRVIQLDNDDNCRKMFKVFAKVNAIGKVSQNDALKSLLLVKYLTRVVGPGSIIGAGSVAERATTIGDGIQNSNDQIVDQRDVIDMVILDAGDSITIEYVTETIRHENVLTNNTTDATTGFVVVDIIIESFAVRTS